MALHINLYHEIHKQAARERRDPVKIATLAGVLVMLFLALWYGHRLMQVMAVERNRNGLRNNWAQMEPQMKAAIENESRLLTRQRSNQILMVRLQERFLWAPFLEKFAAATPSNVQIISLTGEVQTDKENKRVIVVVVRGIAAGTPPRTAAELYRQSLRSAFAETYGNVEAVFDANSLEDGAENVAIEGQTLSTATFRIRLQFNPRPSK